ncbi:MAG: NlpC/P60 family protein [Actinomycetota bacterium]|nr:NlpC/P60 family protein [Actinomycetota bacterium]
MARKLSGRHRAPGFSPLAELADIAAISAQPAMKASAVVVASGGLLATFALPAHAAPGDNGPSLASASQQGAVTAVAGSVGTVAVAAPARPVNAPTFGVIGFTGKAATVTAPAMTIKKIVQAPRAPAAPATRVSRAATRVAVSTATATRTRVATAAPAPAPVPTRTISLPAPSGGILGSARSLSGIPYVWGGISTSGADCSGYTSLVFRSVGISLPRTAEAQRQAATRVTNPAPGDLVFFGFPAYHVGIYAGPGMMYDEQRPGTVSGLHSIWTMTNVSFGRV